MAHAGTLNHHIVRLDPLYPETIDLEEMERIKFNIASGLYQIEE